MRTLIVFLLLAIISLPLGGYQFGVKDQYVTLPIYLRYLDGTYYANDYYYPQPNESRSLYAPLLAFLLPLFPNIPTQFFVLYALLHALWFYAIYKLALLLLRDEGSAFFSLLFFITPKWVAGTGAMTYELSLAYRTIAMPFGLLSLAWFLQKRYLFAFVAFVFATLVHPLTAIYLGYPLYILILNHAKAHLPKFRLVYLLATILPFLLLGSLPIVTRAPFTMDYEWLDIVKNRLPFAFLSRWDFMDFGNVFFFLLLFIISTSLTKILVTKNRKLLTVLGITTLAAFAVPLIGELGHFTPFIQVQFARSLTLPLIVIQILFSGTLYTFISKTLLKPFVWVLIAVIITILSYPIPQAIPPLVFFTPFLFCPKLRTKLAYLIRGTQQMQPALIFISILGLYTLLIISGYKRDPDPHWLTYADTTDTWIDVQLWAKRNTSKDSVFLINPYRSGFRTFSERSPVVEYKDGTASIFSREKGLIWKERLMDIQSLETLTEEEIAHLKSKYLFHYVIRNNIPSHLLSFPRVYENTDFIIYRPN